MQSNSTIHTKLTDFIKKYHINELYKGLSITVILFLSYFIVISFTEISIYFNPETKRLFFYSFILVFLLLAIWFIVKPLLHLFGVINPLELKHANKIIVKHFPDVKDHLINVLQLLDQKQSSGDNSLLIASIEQKTQQLSPIPFHLALDVKSVKKYGFIAVGVIVLLNIVLALWPDFKESSTRILNYTQAYEKPAPFQFEITSGSTVEKGEDYTLSITINGDIVPASLIVNTEFATYYLKQVQSNVFEYTFVNVQDDIQYRLSSGEYTSRSYEISVLPSPAIKNLDIAITPPAYTGLKSFKSTNATSLSVPEGSTVLWNIHTSDADSVIFLHSEKSITVKEDDESYQYSERLLNPIWYSIAVYNQYFSDTTINNFTIDIEKDAYPTISVLERKDTTGNLISYFKGVISDDYGLTALRFAVKNLQSDSIQFYPLSLNKNDQTQEFYYSFDFSDFDQGANFEYYFVVYDNDGVNGSKFTQSNQLYFTLPTEEALAEMEDEVNDELKRKIDQSIEKAQDIQKEIKDLQNKLLNENMSEWQRNQVLENISQQHNELKKLVDEVNKVNDQKNQLFENLSEKDELKKKQEELQELLSQVMDDELQQLMDELDKLKENFDKNKLFEITEDLEMSFEDLEKQLDKDIELLKRYDLERKIENTISELEKSAEEQKELSDNPKKHSRDSLNSQIQKQKDKIENLKEDYKNLTKENNELENKMNLDSFEKEFDDISKSLDDAQQQNNQGKKKQTSQQMNDAGQKSQDLAQKMTQMMQNNQQQQSMENLDDLRQIFDNLLIFSFDEETHIEESKDLKYKDPRMAEFANNQLQLKENFTIIEDSLYALAKREPMISVPINKEVLEIQKNMNSAIRAMENNKRSEARRSQRFVMTSTNNLALLLSEIIRQMQQQMAQQMQGQQQCQNPSSKGKGSPSLSQMKSQQQSLKQQLQQMIDQMKSEQNKSGSKPGGSSQMSKKLSKMLSEQEKYNQQLNQMLKDGEFSPDAMKQLNEIKKLMDKNERDIINRNISQSTMFRQDQIMTRLLEAEKAEREREQDKKRKSETADQTVKANPEKYFLEETKQNSFEDVIEQSSLELNKVYKKIYEEYLIKLSSDN